MHFTHIDNLPSITARHALFADCVLRTSPVTVRECGDVDIKEGRRKTPVRVPPWGGRGRLRALLLRAQVIDALQDLECVQQDGRRGCEFV